SGLAAGAGRGRRDRHGRGERRRVRRGRHRPPDRRRPLDGPALRSDQAPERALLGSGGRALRDADAMIRLAQAMAGAHHGGAETFFVRLALALHRAGQEQRVVIRRDGERAAALRAGGLAPVELPFRGLLDYRTRFGMRRILREYQPQVVLTWMSRATRLCPPGEFVHVGRLGGYYDLKYYRRCDHLIGNTRDIVAYLVRSGWSESRAHYLPNFVPDMSAAPVARAALDTPEDVPLALALGRLHSNKAFDVLIEALARAPGIHLWLAGEGPARAELESHAERLAVSNRVRFLGWREDAAALLAAA